MTALSRAARATLLVLAAALLVACGGKKEDTEVKTAGREQPLDDAIALLPGDAIGFGTVDARAFFSSKTFGAELAKLVEKYLPIGEEAGFRASRDVDRVTWATYSYQGVDVAAIVIGRFDVEKIRAAATSPSAARAGAPIVASQYAGRDVYTVGNVGFTLLSAERAIVGTESGIRRVIERIDDKRVRRDIRPWMIETIETPGAAAAAAGDFATHPAPQEILRQLPTPIVQNLKLARVVATFKEPGVQLAGSLSYPDGDTATAMGPQVQQAANLSRWLALFGITIQNIDVKVEKQDVQVKLEVDDQSLRQLLAAAPQWLGQ